LASLAISCSSNLRNDKDSKATDSRKDYGWDTPRSLSKNKKADLDSIKTSKNHVKDKGLITWDMISKNPKSLILHNNTYKICLSGTISDDLYDLSKIQVDIPSQKCSQVINLKKNKLLWSKEEGNKFIQIVDINLDGQYDLMLLNNAGATGNIWYDTWLFDTVSHSFVYSKWYSELCAAAITKDKKMIKSYSRMGFCDETVWYYKPNGFNEPIPLSNVYTEPDNKSGRSICWKVTVKRKNGKWVETRRDTLVKSLYNTEYLKD